MSEQTLKRQFYNTQFQKELERLNAAQRKAVETIEGPMLVIAGPGTGKTHMLTARIGTILLQSDTKAQNILCLTFTEAGVRAMRQRLLQFIGPEAYRVNIFTFHSFCNAIIRDHMELFGRRGLEPLSELERIDIIRELIDGLPGQHPIKRGRTEVYFYEKHLYELFKHMKKEAWTVELIESQVEAYLKSLPQREEFIYKRKSGNKKKGDLKINQIRDVERRMELLLAAARLYPKYLNLMRAHKRYDYEDMILWVLEAFEKYPTLLRSYQERYLYFLIDEYQDTNGAQNELIRKLIAFWENPNIFIVGDDDQSIYEFQGARLKNLQDFYLDFKDQLSLVLLTDNYRSAQSLLDTATGLIAQNENRILNSIDEAVIDKQLKARNKAYAELATAVQVDIYPNRIQEMVHIANQIQEYKDQGQPLEEIGVLYARHRQAEYLITLLERKNIPYQVKKDINILEEPLIQSLRTVLEYFALESELPFGGEHLLFKILHFEFIGVPHKAVAQLSLQLGQMNVKDRPEWRTIVEETYWLDHFGIKPKKPFHQWSHFFNTLLFQLYEISLPAFIERVINRSGFLQFTASHPQREYYIQLLSSFMNFIRSECKRNPLMTLQELIELLKKIDTNRITIPLQKSVDSDRGVQLLTAHSAKGLEFETVFLIDCVKEQWQPGNRHNNYRFSLPDTLTYSGEEDALEARRRLFFVAMTRAKAALHISYSRQDENGKDLNYALFIDELQKSDQLVFREIFPEKATVLESQLEGLREAPITDFSDYQEEWVKQLLQEFKLSVSSLNSYLYCPLGFFYEHLLKVPVQEREAALFGTAIHNSLQRLFDQISLRRRKSFPELRVLLRFFEQEMAQSRGRFSEKNYQIRLDLGKQQLTQYYQTNVEEWPSEVRTEYLVRNVEWEGIPLVGVIDRLDTLKGQVLRVVDYKTGKPDSTKVKGPAPSRPHGGNYWRQLYFYKLLLDQRQGSLELTTQGVISFITPDINGQNVDISIKYDQEGLFFIKNLVKETYRKIQNQEFEACGKEECPWCQFFGQNIAPNSFARKGLEELDD